MTSEIVYPAGVLSIGASIAARIAFSRMENAGQDQESLSMTGINRHKQKRHL
jgi:hypothetical protein